jgi:SPP1 gp7 family putative phage head morphogenesis protein
MSITFKEAVDFVTAKKVVLPEEYYGSLQQKSRSRAFSIAGIASRDQLQGVLDSLNDVLRKGTTFDEWKKLASTSDLGLPEYRLDNIFRTNMQSAYNAGHWTQQQRVKDKRPFLMYDAINDSRVRPSHLALDNVIKPIDDPFWNVYYPPNGFRCRCSTINLTEAQTKARGGVTPDPENGWLPPDKGWDYNGADLDEGISRGSKQSPRGDSNLQRAMERQVSEQKAAQTTAARKVADAKVLDAWIGDVPQELEVVFEGVKRTLIDSEICPEVFSTKLSSIRAVDSSEMLDSTYGDVAAEYDYADFSLKLNNKLATRKEAESIIIHELGHHIESSFIIRQGYMDAYNTIRGEYAEHVDLVAKTLGISRDVVKWGLTDELAGKLASEGVATVSTYALTDPQEWFADSFREFILMPSRLRQVAPRTFAAISKFTGKVSK